MKIIILLVLFSTGTVLPLLAQRLRVNEPLPLESLPVNVRNLVEAHRGKYILVDLFASSCSACFSAFPKLKTLQTKFAGRLQIILIGKADKHVEPVYRRFEANYQLTFPVAYDSFFHDLSGTGYFPTYIWIDSSGIVKAITGSSEVDEKNLYFFLKNGSVRPKVVVPEFDKNRPYLIAGNGGDDTSFLFRSLITRWKDGQPRYLPNSITQAKTNNSLQLLGATLDQLYRFAYTGKFYWSERDSFYQKFYSLPVKEGDFHISEYEPGDRFNYSLMTTEMIGTDGLLQFMQEDLDRSLPYKANIERRLMPYWKLVLVGNDTMRVASDFTRISGQRTHAGIDMKGLPIAELISILHSYYPFGPIFVNETGMIGRVNIKFDAVMQDIRSLKLGLQEAGFDLQEGKRWMDVIILMEKPKSVGSSFHKEK